MFKFGVITDEVSQDLSEAVEFAKKYSIDCLELRSIREKTVFEYNREDVKEMQRIIEGSGLSVCALSTNLFKCSYYDKEDVKAHIEGFKRSLEWADMLGAGLIRGFDFWADKEKPVPLEARAELYRQLSEMLPPEVSIVVEYDPSVASPCPSKLKELVAAVAKPNVGALFDPGNCIYYPGSERPYPEGYEILKPYTRHLHIKDAVRGEGRTISTPVGEGAVDYKGLFAALIADGFDGCCVLETHHRINAQIDEALLRLPAGSAFSNGGKLASEISMVNIHNIIAGITGKKQ